MTMGYDDDMMADLADLDNEFLEVEPAERKAGGNTVPNGTYQAKIERLYFDRTRDGTKIMLKWELHVAIGEYEGEVLYRNNMTSSEDTLRWLKADLLAAGLDTSGMKMTDIPAHLEGMLDRMLEVNVKRSGSGDDTRVNVYINRVVERDAPAEAPAAPSRTAPRTSAPATREPATAGASTASTGRNGGGSRGLSRF